MVNALRELQHRDHCQLPWRNPRLATGPERVNERPVGEDLAQLITYPHGQRPFRNAALATAAVCSGTSGSAHGRIDIATHSTRDADAG
jgi:hypothetical protein